MLGPHIVKDYEVFWPLQPSLSATANALVREFTWDHFANRPLSFLTSLTTTVTLYYAIIYCLISHAVNLWLRLTFLQKATNYAAQAMSNHNISFYELRSTALVGLGFFTINSSLTPALDDTIDSMLMGVLAYVISSLIAAVVSLNLKLLYSILPSSGGSSLRRNAVSCFTNTALCVLRILLCWARYALYDSQVESIDSALHYADELFDLSPLPDNHLAETILIAVADTLTTLVQIVLSFFKQVIAAFILWLITDLFSQRPQVRFQVFN